jgi:hypothetical protein
MNAELKRVLGEVRAVGGIYLWSHPQKPTEFVVLASVHGQLFVLEPTKEIQDRWFSDGSLIEPVKICPGA